MLCLSFPPCEQIVIFEDSAWRPSSPSTPWFPQKSASLWRQYPHPALSYHHGFMSSITHTFTQSRAQGSSGQLVNKEAPWTSPQALSNRLEGIQEPALTIGSLTVLLEGKAQCGKQSIWANTMVLATLSPPLSTVSQT